MNGFVGMDSKEVRRVAAGLHVQAQHVASIIGHVESLVSQSAGHWHGPDSSDFAHRWSSAYRPRMDALRGWLDEMSRTAAHNADQQDGTSRADGGLASPGSAGGGARNGAGGGSSDWLDVVGGVALYGGFLLGKATMLAEDRFSVGRYSNWWTKNVLDKAGDHADLFRFKTSPVAHFLNSKSGIFGFADGASKVISVFNMGSTAFDLYNHVASGDIGNGIGDALQVAGDGLGLVKATPVTYLSSVILKQGAFIAHEATKSDWSPGAFNDTMSYAVNNLDETGAAFKDAAVQIFTKDLWSWL